MFDKNNHYELIHNKFTTGRNNLIMYALMNYDKANETFLSYYKDKLYDDIYIEDKLYSFQNISDEGILYFKNMEGHYISLERREYSFYDDLKNNPDKLKYYKKKIDKEKAKENFCEISYIITELDSGKTLTIRLGTKLDNFKISLLSKDKLFSVKFRKKIVNKLSSFNIRINDRLTLVNNSKIPIYKVFYYNRNRGEADMKNGGFRRNGYELADYVFDHIFH
jgi:aryl-phospho-beta-D-glucosidase BglC (GH1 family)